jgi:hypothetical protein
MVLWTRSMKCMMRNAQCAAREFVLPNEILAYSGSRGSVRGRFRRRVVNVAFGMHRYANCTSTRTVQTNYLDGA